MATPLSPLRLFGNILKLVQLKEVTKRKVYYGFDEKLSDNFRIDNCSKVNIIILKVIILLVIRIKGKNVNKTSKCTRLTIQLKIKLVTNSSNIENVETTDVVLKCLRKTIDQHFNEILAFL